MLLKGEKKTKTTMASLQRSERPPLDWGLRPELATIVDRRGTSSENAQKRDSPGDSPSPSQDPDLSAKVTTGGLSAPVSRGKVRCHLLWIDGSQPPVHAPLINIDIEEPPVVIMVEKQKVIFLLDSGACFSVLPFSPGHQSNDKDIVRGKSGQPLERYFTWPLAYSWGNLIFCHSFLIVPETPVTLLGWDLRSQLKAQILLPPGDYLCCPLPQE
jgi:hypothetical protein